MPNKTIYLRQFDVPLWEQARARFGERGISRLFTAFLRENLALREGYLHVVWADDNSDFEQGQFAILFAPLDAAPALAPLYCRSSQELFDSLDLLGVSEKAIEGIREGVKTNRSASARVSLSQEVMPTFHPVARQIEHTILRMVAESQFTRGLAAHQNNWTGWWNSIRDRGDLQCTAADVVAAFKRLRKRGILRLSKPAATGSESAEEPLGSETDEEQFFFRGRLAATITEQGRSFWLKVNSAD